MSRRRTTRAAPGLRHDAARAAATGVPKAGSEGPGMMGHGPSSTARRSIASSRTASEPSALALAYAIAASTNAMYRASPLSPAWLTKSGLVVASVMRPVLPKAARMSRSPVSIESVVIEASCRGGGTPNAHAQFNSRAREAECVLSSRGAPAPTATRAAHSPRSPRGAAQCAARREHCPRAAPPPTRRPANRAAVEPPSGPTDRRSVLPPSVD
jgi:hypothetical protein